MPSIRAVIGCWMLDVGCWMFTGVIEWACPAIAFGLFLLAPCALEAAEVRAGQDWPGADLFAGGPIRQLHIEIPPTRIASLREDPRKFVRAAIREEGTSYADVAVHLKGAVGSFREVEDRPSLTLDFNRFDARQRFHGLRRIHLNNSVEDPSCCNELLGSDLFRAAGIPAPRVAHAVVTLNGRRIGLYVLVEGFTEDFLGCYFKRVGGDLYEPGEGHDVNLRLSRNSVQAPVLGREALKALAAAALETDPVARWPRLEQSLAVDEFVTFMAMEVMLGHRDGYCLARNNYRVYYDLDSNKIVFFPHGMDQLLGNPDAVWQPHMAGLVAKAVMETGEGRQRYRTRLTSLFTNVFQVPLLKDRVDQVVARLGPALTASEFAAVKAEADHLKDRVVLRQRCLERQLSEPERGRLVFTKGMAALSGWVKVDEHGAQMEQCLAPDHASALHILARSQTTASWRAQVLLGHGRYRFEGQAKVAGVKPLPYGKHQGAGLRIAGNVRESGGLLGDSKWRDLAAEFEVAEGSQEVELVCELRASAGEAWFGTESLRLAQVGTVPANSTKSAITAKTSTVRTN
jgi:spore coat protein H